MRLGLGIADDAAAQRAQRLVDIEHGAHRRRAENQDRLGFQHLDHGVQEGGVERNILGRQRAPPGGAPEGAGRQIGRVEHAGGLQGLVHHAPRLAGEGLPRRILVGIGTFADDQQLRRGRPTAAHQSTAAFVAHRQARKALDLAIERVQRLRRHGALFRFGEEGGIVDVRQGGGPQRRDLRHRGHACHGFLRR